MSKKKNKKDVKKAQGVQKKGIAQALSDFKQFFEQSKVEMKKVTYPDRKQILTTCGSVLVLLLIISLFLGVVDIALAKIMKIFLP